MHRWEKTDIVCGGFCNTIEVIALYRREFKGVVPELVQITDGVATESQCMGCGYATCHTFIQYLSKYCPIMCWAYTRDGRSGCGQRESLTTDEPKEVSCPDCVAYIEQQRKNLAGFVPKEIYIDI